MRTFAMKCLPKTTMSPFSACSKAEARVYPPAVKKGRGDQMARRKSFDFTEDDHQCYASDGCVYTNLALLD